MHSDQSKSDIQVGKSIKEHKQRCKRKFCSNNVPRYIENLTSTSDMTKIVI